jgi:hypothetical protein
MSYLIGIWMIQDVVDFVENLVPAYLSQKRVIGVQNVKLF